ncbi:MAG: hypothetical protein K6F39_06560 [Lachnospiraceae bacterium]|nr:hypothetical protein [Lachnospiraceae bacterium]
MIQAAIIGGLLLLAIIFIVQGIKALNYNKIQKENCTCVVTGRIVDWERVEKRYEIEHNKVFITYNPVYEYEYNGNKYRKISISGMREPGNVGLSVAIHLNPSEPDMYYADTDMEKKATENGPVIFLLIGGVLVIAAIVAGVILSYII